LYISTSGYGALACCTPVVKIDRMALGRIFFTHCIDDVLIIEFHS
jgi:hypothetical protein